MNPRSYVDLKEGGRNLQPTYYFMINCLLYSRMETGLVLVRPFEFLIASRSTFVRSKAQRQESRWKANAIRNT